MQRQELNISSFSYHEFPEFEVVYIVQHSFLFV